MIDRFVINVSSSAFTTERRNYSGIFGFAIIDMSSEIICVENFYGPNCDQVCVEENCTCNPRFTGVFCETITNECLGIECGLNKRCVDLHLNYSCECEAGYTDPECQTDIDYCSGVNCNNGSCMDGLTSFECVCDPAFTGDFCETRRDGYELHVTIHSFSNPGGRCAGVNSDYDCNGCCDHRQCTTTTCEYFFSFCQRPAGSPVSLARIEYQGNCSTVNTTAQTSDGGMVFTDSVFNITNPIIFSGSQWVSEIL